MLYGLGSNGSGQLGIGHVDDVSTATATSGDLKSRMGSPLAISRVVAGGNHNLVLTTDGTVYASGNNEDGRCGLHGSTSSSELRALTTATGTESEHQLKVDHLAATWAASIFVEAGGECVSVCGSGESGELGLGEDIRSAVERTQIAGFPPQGSQVIHLAACMAHFVAVLSNGEVWGWGKGRKGQLGEPFVDVWKPRKIEGVPFSVATAVCGKDFTCVIGAPPSGELLLLGPKSNDRFGIRANAPSAVPGWKSISASWGSVFILLDDGKIVAWGRDDHGQLPPPNLPQTKKLAAGSEHCVAIATDGRVLAWGWGEHGNCGEPTNEQGDVKGIFNQVSVSGRVEQVFAGCATSFISTSDDDNGG